MGSQLLSYKQYKLLNETLGSPVTLGLAKPFSLGVIGNKFTPEELAAIELEEGKKKKKKMDDDEVVEIDAETGDGEVVDDEKAPPKDKPKEKCDCDKDDCPICNGVQEEATKSSKKKKKMSNYGVDKSKDLGKEDVDLDDEDTDLDDEDEDVDLDDEDDDDDDDEDVDLDDIEGGELGMMKKKMKKGMKKKAKKGMKKEEAEWWTSVHNMLDGFSTVTEESLLAPQDPNEGLASDEPGPGEVGYAPSGRIGSF